MRWLWPNPRRALRYLWMAVRCLFPYRMRPLVVLPLLPEEGEVSHPSELCRCPDDGWGMRRSDHEPGCEWAAAMCRTCDGSGHCPVCFGDGTHGLSDHAHAQAEVTCAVHKHNHSAGESGATYECMACGVRDCPHGEPLHYHHDGCPACDEPPEVSR